MLKNIVLAFDGSEYSNRALQYAKTFAEPYTVKGDLTIRFRAIRLSYEKGMGHLFYRYSGETVYYLYFQSVSSMRHAKIQGYVNVDFNQVISMVGQLTFQELFLTTSI